MKGYATVLADAAIHTRGWAWNGGAIDWASFPSDVIATFLGAFLGFLAALGLEYINRRHTQRTRAAESETRASQVQNLIIDELRRNRLQLAELQLELSSLDVPSYAPERTIWNALSSEYLANHSDTAFPELYSEVARIERLVADYRRATQQGAHAAAVARGTTLPRLNEAVQHFLDQCNSRLP